MCHFDGFQGLGYRTDLIEFDQDAVSTAKLNSLCQTLGICYKQVIAHQLYFIANFCGKFFPAFPVFFVQCILDGDDWIFLNQFFPMVDQLL